MEQAITEFIHSEHGEIVAIVLLLIGLADIGSGWFLTKYRRDLIPVPDDKLQPIMTALFFAAALMLMAGLYILIMRA